MITEVTTVPAEVLPAMPGCEFLSLQNDDPVDGGSDIFISFGGADMTSGETPAPAGYRLAPGATLVLTNTSPLVKQAAVWAVTATGSANLRSIRH